MENRNDIRDIYRYPAHRDPSPSADPRHALCVALHAAQALPQAAGYVARPQTHRRRRRCTHDPGAIASSRPLEPSQERLAQPYPRRSDPRPGHLPHRKHQPQRPNGSAIDPHRPESDSTLRPHHERTPRTVSPRPVATVRPDPSPRKQANHITRLQLKSRHTHQQRPVAPHLSLDDSVLAWAKQGHASGAQPTAASAARRRPDRTAAKHLRTQATQELRKPEQRAQPWRPAHHAVFVPQRRTPPQIPPAPRRPLHHCSPRPCRSRHHPRPSNTALPAQTVGAHGQEDHPPFPIPHATPHPTFLTFPKHAFHRHPRTATAAPHFSDHTSPEHPSTQATPEPEKLEQLAQPSRPVNHDVSPPQNSHFRQVQLPLPLVQHNHPLRRCQPRHHPRPNGVALCERIVAAHHQKGQPHVPIPHAPPHPRPRFLAPPQYAVRRRSSCLAPHHHHHSHPREPAAFADPPNPWQTNANADYR